MGGGGGGLSQNGLDEVKRPRKVSGWLVQGKNDVVGGCDAVKLLGVHG